MSTHKVSVTVPIRKKAKNGTNGSNGNDAKYVIVTGDQVFSYSNDFTGNPTPTSITLSARLFGNLSGYQWSYKRSNQSSFTDLSGATSATYSVAHNNTTIWGSDNTIKSVTLRCTSGGYFDEITISKVSSGKGGADAYTVILGNESHAFAGGTTAAVAGTTECSVIAYKGASQVAATIGTISGCPSGMSTEILSNGTTSAKFKVTVTTSLTATAGTLTVPITVDRKTFTKYFSWTVSRNGANGTNGTNGTNGRGISSANVYYGVSTSGTTAPADSDFTADTMSSLITSANKSKYLWEATKTTYTDSTTSFSGKNCLGLIDDIATGVEVYALSDSSNAIPVQNSTNYKTTYTPTAGKWLWTCTLVNNSWYTTPHCVGYFGTNGTNGKDGYSERLIFCLSYGKPTKPTGNSPTGWESAPQKDTNISTVGIECTGDFVSAGSWRVCNGGDVHNINKVDTINLSTTANNQKIVVIMEVSTEKNYDFGYLSKIDNNTAFAKDTNASNYSSKISDNTYSITEFTLSAGLHFLRCGYTKDASKSGTYDFVRYTVLLHKLCWMSKSLTYDNSGNVTSWSEPTLFDTIDGMNPRGRMPKFEGAWEAGKNYYCTDDLQSIVVYNNSFYLCLSSHVSSNSNNPTTPIWKKSVVTGDFVATKILFAERAKINNLFVDDVETVPINGQAHVKIQGSTMEVFGALGICNIKFGVNGDGMAVLEYYNNDGMKLYDLGPNGISQVLTGVSSSDGYMETMHVKDFGSSCPDGQQVRKWLFGDSNYYQTINENTRCTNAYSANNKKYIFHSGITAGNLKYPSQNKKVYVSDTTTGSGNQKKPADGNSLYSGWCASAPPTQNAADNWGVPYSSYTVTSIGLYVGYFMPINRYVNGVVERTVYVML